MTLTSPDAVGAPPPEQAPEPQPGSRSIPDRCRALINNRNFELFIVGVIVINAIVLGIGTYPSVAGPHEPLLATIYDVILGIYVVELLIRLTAYRWNPREFVKDGWNVFDFIVVVAVVRTWAAGERDAAATGAAAAHRAPRALPA